MEKFELLYSVLRDLNAAGILDQIILIGSWCQDFYKRELDKSDEIPAARTTDADFFVPKRLSIKAVVDIALLLENRGFVKEIQYKTGVTKFTHPDLKIEFLTNAGAKSDEGPYEFKKLKITAQELHFMGIPQYHHKRIRFRDLTINIPEPEAFALHKLIISQRRLKPEKAEKDLEAARALFKYFEGREKHIQRLNEILSSLPKGWRNRVDKALEDSGVKIDYLKKEKAKENKTIFQIFITTKEYKEYTYDISISNEVIQNYTKDQIDKLLNLKAQKIIKHDPKLKNEKITKIKIIPI